PLLYALSLHDALPIYHIRALADPRFFCETIWEGEQFCGLIFYWELSGFQYIEHLAIEPSLRGSGIGSRCLEEFCKRNQKIVLEIDRKSTRLNSTHVSI